MALMQDTTVAIKAKDVQVLNAGQSPHSERVICLLQPKYLKLS